ncbi:hypothetical protein DSO57_1023410 [Entomophthora muscae]|uniref:Uncharacterized protein n=1 Tax=Entomophthora muscae TaxID=34485 RepID=A0ACC2U177_9FUNG|nr:hypothetical protein DSO57_1023410 [Entomophthora muscae]
MVPPVYWLDSEPFGELFGDLLGVLIPQEGVIKDVATSVHNNRVSATQVHTQEGDRRGVFNSDTALTQPVQGAQAARVQSINSQVPKLTQKPTKVTATKTVRNKEIELASYVLDAVYRQELVPSAMMEKVKPVLDTTYGQLPELTHSASQLTECQQFVDIQ